MSDFMKPLISAASDRELTKNEAEAAFQILFEGAATPAQIGGFLMALRTRGETVTEFAAAASVMRAKCNAVSAPADAMDIVGTGGDGFGTYNISTASAFVVAGCGHRQNTHSTWSHIGSRSQGQGHSGHGGQRQRARPLLYFWQLRPLRGFDRGCFGCAIARCI